MNTPNNMLDEEWKEIADEKSPAKNLKFALLAVGYSAVASVSFFLVMDSFGLKHNITSIRVMVGVYYVLTIVSGVYAFLACRNSLKSLRTNKNTRNYIALVIGGLLLLGICRQIFEGFSNNTPNSYFKTSIGVTKLPIHRTSI